MPKPGFQLNYKTVGKILKSDAAAAAVRAAAEKVLAETNDDEADIVEYTTDRKVAAVRVPADKQARHGTGTKALNRARG